MTSLVRRPPTARALAIAAARSSPAAQSQTTIWLAFHRSANAAIARATFTAQSGGAEMSTGTLVRAAT